MAIPDPPKAGSPFCALWTGGWNPKTPKINNFFIPEITLRGGYNPGIRVLRGDRNFGVRLYPWVLRPFLRWWWRAW